MSSIHQKDLVHQQLFDLLQTNLFVFLEDNFSMKKDKTIEDTKLLKIEVNPAILPLKPVHLDISLNGKICWQTSANFKKSYF